MTPQQMFNQAVSLYQQGRFADAEALYRQLLALAPDSAETWTNLGAALQGQGRLAEALASYSQAVAHKLAHVPAWHYRARVLFALSRMDEALESVDRACELAPKNMEFLYDRAAILHVAQRFPEALVTLEKILAIHPDYPAALILRGALLCETSRVPEGLESYRRHAEAVFAGKPIPTPDDPEHKKRHDAEQQEWLKARGLPAKRFHLEKGARIQGPAVNPANRQEVTRRWLESKPQIVVIDDLLTPPALEALRNFCWGSTMWRRPYPNGYLGAVPEQGFACPLLAQIADELREVFPAVIGAHGLGLMWGFKYDSHLTGIPMHADQAAVNVNFWITPDDANRDAESGGLVVWDVKAPLDWDFTRYNGNEEAIRAFLTRAGARPIVIPHRANRAVVFDSDLFHATDKIDFKDGYENRRINVTMLYGRRTFHGE